MINRGFINGSLIVYINLTLYGHYGKSLKRRSVIVSRRWVLIILILQKNRSHVTCETGIVMALRTILKVERTRVSGEQKDDE